MGMVDIDMLDRNQVLIHTQVKDGEVGNGAARITVDNQADQRIRQAGCIDVTSRENLARGAKSRENFYERPNVLACVKVYMVSILIAT